MRPELLIVTSWGGLHPSKIVRQVGLRTPLYFWVLCYFIIVYNYTVNRIIMLMMSPYHHHRLLARRQSLSKTLKLINYISRDVRDHFASSWYLEPGDSSVHTGHINWTFISVPSTSSWQPSWSSRQNKIALIGVNSWRQLRSILEHATADDYADAFLSFFLVFTIINNNREHYRLAILCYLADISLKIYELTVTNFLKWEAVRWKRSNSFDVKESRCMNGKIKARAMKIALSEYRMVIVYATLLLFVEYNCVLWYAGISVLVMNFPSNFVYTFNNNSLKAVYALLYFLLCITEIIYGLHLTQTAPCHSLSLNFP